MKYEIKYIAPSGRSVATIHRTLKDLWGMIAFLLSRPEKSITITITKTEK